MRVLFDTNVVLDVVLKRTPFADAAGYLFDLIDSGQLGGILAPTTLTTVSYFIEKDRSAAVARETLRRLAGRFEVATVGRAVVEDALALEFSDFEDSVLHEAARHAGASAIVTRNVEDFAAGSISIYEPNELLTLIRDT